MNGRQGLNSSFVLALLFLAALFLIAVPTQALAVDCSIYDCTGTDPDGNDTDLDGFTDFRECCGIDLPGGGSYPLCTGVPGEDRNSCVHPDTPDLFVIMTRATQCFVPGDPDCDPLFNIDADPDDDSNIPLQADYGTIYDPFALVYASQAEGGLGVATHEIAEAQAGPDREITFDTTVGATTVPGQKAVWVRESLYTGGEAFGEATFGTPNTVGLATIYTQEIVNFIDEKCDGATLCRDISHPETPADWRPDLYYMQIQNTIAHEISHLMVLAVVWNDRFGGPHYKAGTGVLMEQFTIYTKKGSKVTFYISQDYSPESQHGFHLK